MLSIEELLSVTSQGYRVFPLSPGTKIPYKSTAGVMDATANEQKVREWYAKYPTCNWGIAGGHISARDEYIIFIDVDTKPGKNGKEELEDLFRQYGKPPETFIVKTPSGGWHIYLRTQVKKTRYRARLKGCKHIDVKCEGGYVVLFGSETPDGPYTALRGEFGTLGSIEEWFTVDAEIMVHGREEKEYERVGKVKLHDGQWSYFTSWAGKYRADGLTGEALFAALWQRALEKGDPIPDDWWIRGIAEGYNKYPDTLGADDQSNADRFLAAFGREVLHSTGIGWLVWNNKQWAIDREDKRVTYMAGELIPSTKYQATLSDKVTQKTLLRAARMIASAGSRKSMISLAMTDPIISKEPTEFDNDAYLFNCQNGTVDLRTGHLEPHNHSQLITRIAPVDYDPEAACPVFDSFLQDITLGEEDVKLFLQRYLGYAMTGSVAEQLFAVFYGSGGNGKSVLVNTVSTILGDYSLETPVDTIAHKTQAGGPTNDLARFRGARLITARETNQGHRLDESLIKSLTGGDSIVARFLHKEFFEFKPVAKWILFTNHKPQIRGGDEGIWRRIRLVPFRYKVPEEKRDKSLEAKLINEAPGILNWLIAGARGWVEEGLPQSIAVDEATKEYRRDEDKLADFVDAVCLVGGDKSVLASPLYNAYYSWCQANHERPLSRKVFPAAMEERGFARDRGRKGVFYRGIALDESAREEESHNSDF